LSQRWIKRIVDRNLSRLLKSACGIGDLAANTLSARGLHTVEEAKRFLSPDIKRDWSDPESITGMHDVAEALERAILAKKRILVFGDYDVDGICATAIMIRGLKELGVQADFLIPNRIEEGYGLTVNVLKRIYEKSPEVLITVDCGISAKREVEELQSFGIEVLITDHHEPSEGIPTNIPVADPKLEEHSASSILSGAGVALKLIALLGQRLGKPELWYEYLDLVTLGTLADFMPLVDENRSLVAAGLVSIERNPRPGLAAALAFSKMETEALTSTALSFTLIPRLNAAGRMGDSLLALHLLLTDDHAQARTLAAELEAVNENRRQIEAKTYEEAEAHADTMLRGQKVLVLSGDGWHEGVKGIVAARLVAHFGVPTIVFTAMNGELRGSGRGVGTVNLFKRVEECSDLLIRFGGHEAAVGLTIVKDNLEEFRKRLEKIFESEPPDSMISFLSIDDEIELSQLDVASVSQLRLLEPFGKENDEPLYCTRAVYLQNTRAVGASKSHLSCTVTDGRTTVQAICFKCPNIEHFIAYAGPTDILYHVRLEEWNGKTRIKLYMKSMIRRFDKSAGNFDKSRRVEVKGIPCAPCTCNSEKCPDETSGKTAHLRCHWEAKLQQEPDRWMDNLTQGILGADVQLHASQKKALEVLSKGSSVLAIMATGRGKSLIFQVHAAEVALRKKAVSVFIYPLRALIADQSAFITERFRYLGLKACSLTGENSTAEKDRIFQRLYEGDLDVILTTPEFFQLHDWRFYQSLRIRFIVFDEAHHIETELQAGRNAYYHLQTCRSTFPGAQFLAVTATSDDRITTGICTALAIEQVIIDNTKRKNLILDDARNLVDREVYLASITAQATKTIVYTNSRDQAVSLVRYLRKQTSFLPQSIAFYHAGLKRDERAEIEDGFRAGRLKTIVSTSAFGEGINIADISDVVLYHLPFSTIAFNQMSGRAGRSGKKATIHLLFNEKDAVINRQILASIAPTRESLVTLYRALKTLARQSGRATVISTSIDQLSKTCYRCNPEMSFEKKGIENSLAVFEELGLLTYEIDDESLLISIFDTINKVELSASSRYLEGMEELALFEQFRQWVFEASPEDLRLRIIGPLLPDSYGYE